MSAMGAPKRAWPPVGLYELTQFPERITEVEQTFLIGGETAVYYMRTEPGNYDNSIDEPGACYDGSRDEYRAQYINQLLKHSFSSLTIAPYPRFAIKWKGEAAYKQQLLDYLEKRRADFRSAVFSLSNGSYPSLTEEEAAGLELRIELVIGDNRRNRSTPLPAILPSDGKVALRPALTKPLL